MKDTADGYADDISSGTGKSEREILEEYSEFDTAKQIDVWQEMIKKHIETGDQKYKDLADKMGEVMDGTYVPESDPALPSGDDT